MPEPEADVEEHVGPRPIWSGAVTFGLVSVPVNLFSALRRDVLPFRMLGESGAPVSRRWVCSKDGNEVDPDHIVRGYEVEQGKHVVITDEELERLAPAKSRDIALERFVELQELDTALFDRPYVLTPAGENTKAYRLLAEIMERSKRAGIATFVMRGKEYLVAILAENGVLRAETLHFPDEIRSPEKIGLPQRAKVERRQVAAFEKAIAARAKPAPTASDLADPYAAELEKLVERKRKKHQDVVEAPEEEAESGGAEPIDLLEVLKRSMKASGAGRARAHPRKRSA